MREALLLVHLIAGFALSATAQDTTAASAHLRRAEADYLTALRRYPVLMPGSGSGGRCDEVIAGVCVIWDTGERALPPRPRQVKAAADSLEAAVTRALPLVRSSPSLEHLLSPKEWKRYRKLSPAARAEYDSILWRFADPLYLTPENEVLDEHRSRTLLAGNAPREVPELVLRFGLPWLRTQWSSFGSLASADGGYSDHWNPAQRTYIPPDLPQALASRPRLDSIWPVDSIVRYSGHAPPNIRAMHVLEHQAAVVRHRLIVRGRAQTDVLGGFSHSRGALFLLDSGLHVLSRATATLKAEADSLVFDASADLPSTARYYSAEVYDSVTHTAAQARFAIDGREGVLLDLTRPVIAAGTTTKLHAEVEGLWGAVTVSLTTKGSSRKNKRPKTVTWKVDAAPSGATSIDLDLNLGSMAPGRYEIELAVRDASGNSRLASKRQLLVINANRASSSGRP